MNIVKFIEQFPDENTCKADFVAKRQQVGMVCASCKGTAFHYLKNRESFSCKKCQKRVRLRSGTFMEQSKMPFRYWYMCIHLLTSTKKTFSALELQRQLGHKYYEPILNIVTKVRWVMGQSENDRKLGSFVEMDEGFFSNIDKKNGSNEAKKRGRGSQNRTKVLVAIESEPVNPEKKPSGKNKYKIPRKVGNIRIKVAEKLDGPTVKEFTESAVHKSAIIHTDGYASYEQFEKMDYEHIATIGAGPKLAGHLFPWVHTAISNAKRLITGIHHGVTQARLQLYLDEYCWKFNRRYEQHLQFNELLTQGAQFRWVTSYR